MFPRNDLFYPIFTLFNENVSTLNEQLSRKLYGNYGTLSVPVTPGWFAYHYFVFRESILLIYAYSFCFGIFNGFLENKTWTSNSLIVSLFEEEKSLLRSEISENKTAKSLKTTAQNCLKLKKNCLKTAQNCSLIQNRYPTFK